VVLVLEYAKLAPVNKQSNYTKKERNMMISYILGLFHNPLLNVRYRVQNGICNGVSERCGSGCGTF